MTTHSPIRPWHKFRRNPLAMGGLVFIALVSLVALLGPLIRPDASRHANDQHLAWSRRKPGTSITVVEFPASNRSAQPWYDAWWNGRQPISEQFEAAHIREDGAGLFAVPASVRDTASWRRLGAAPHARNEWKMPPGTRDINRVFLLGTDKYGRDLLSRLMAGASVSLAVGAIAVFISLLVGLTIGMIAGYYRGWADAVLMWFTNVVWSIPTLLLVMAITFAFGAGFWKVFLAVGLTMWVEVARVARGQVLSAREKEYVEAARALGFPDRRIIFRHILPNILSPLIVISAANFASAILIEAGLSFLGLGAQIPAPSWGNMIREHYAYLTTDLAYLALVPGLLIMLLVLAFMMVGNGLRDALDVRA